MSVLPSTPYSVSAPAALPLLTRAPAKLLEYRGEADADAEFIPKTVAGFTLGAIAMFICFDLTEAIVVSALQHIPVAEQFFGLVTEFAFMAGITFVGASLLLVGLKVRADHASMPLYARHWVNSLGTGAIYAVMIWAPWLFVTQGMRFNRFVAAIICMLLISFPALAARWTIGPHTERERPVA